MLGAVSVRVTAGHPDIPLRKIPVFVGSAMTVEVVDAPRTGNGVTIEAISVSVENAAGAVVSVAATRSGGVWTATIPASHFAAVGVVAMGVTISASGTDENGAARSWIVGKGDLSILPADGVPVPGETLQNVHLRDAVPATPLKGDLCEGANGWQIYTGGEWAVISPDLSNYAKKSDATLTARYSQTPAFGAWTLAGFPAGMTDATLEYNMGADHWEFSATLTDETYGARVIYESLLDETDPDATSMEISAFDGPSGETISGTATRERTDIIGYILGSQTTKPLASEAEAEALRTGKADKPSTAPTNGNFAGWDASGKLTDSGKAPADFATAAQGAKADAPIQPATRDASNNITSFYAAYRDGDLLGVGQFPSWTAHNLKADASALPASETWTFEVDDGQGGTTTVTKNVAVYAAGGNA